MEKLGGSEGENKTCWLTKARKAMRQESKRKAKQVGQRNVKKRGRTHNCCRLGWMARVFEPTAQLVDGGVEVRPDELPFVIAKIHDMLPILPSLLELSTNLAQLLTQLGELL